MVRMGGVSCEVENDYDGRDCGLCGVWEQQDKTRFHKSAMSTVIRLDGGVKKVIQEGSEIS